MQLWLQWWSVVSPLRQTCRDKRSFLWLCTALAGFCVRPDLLGVSSTVRALGLAARCYDRLLDCFHSPAIAPGTLSRRWTTLALQRFSPHRLAGRLVLLGDGIKIPKSGRKMPAVKRLHQASENNTKPEFIMGHSVQVVSVLVAAAGSFLAVPLCAGRVDAAVRHSRFRRKFPALSKLRDQFRSWPVLRCPNHDWHLISHADRSVSLSWSRVRPGRLPEQATRSRLSPQARS